jgi:hypothetical protein
MARVPAVPLAAAALLLALAIADSRGSWAAESATVQEILDGQELFINQKQAAPKDRASAPQTVSTRNSRGQLAFSSGAAGRINRFSLLRLGSSCFLVEKGQILVSGKQNGCTRSARLSVRGTNYLIDVQEDGSAELSVLEGSVDVEQLQDGESTGKPAILSGPLFSGFRSTLPGFAALESHIRSFVPGVSLPSAPSVPSVPSLPGLRRFGIF